MITKEELEKKYADMPVSELLEIVDNKFDYTELAVATALAEVAKRNISPQQIEDYKNNQLQKFKHQIKFNVIDDLSLLQKNFFFFIWLPLVTLPFKQNFRDDGLYLKLSQANYYSWFGFISIFIISLLGISFDFSTLTTLAIWIIAFLPAYACDEFFNRQRRIKRLQKFFDNLGNKEKDPENS